MHLHVVSNCTDTDFAVTITDVYPSGESILITDQLLRMRWRDSIVTPSLITPGKIYSLVIGMSLLLHVHSYAIRMLADCAGI